METTNSMYLNGKHIKSCDGDDIFALIKNAVPESRNLEYKIDVPSAQDEDRKEFLKDVAGLTNGGGGVILYGVAEEVDEKKQNTGRPKEIVGIDASSADKLILGMQETLKACIKPRIPEVEIGVKKVEPGKLVLFVATARSLLAPHMAEFKGNIYFYSRVSSGKFAMSVEEIRAAFLNMSNLVEQVNRWHNERLELLHTYYGTRTPTFAVHIIPVGAQLETIRIPVIRMREVESLLEPLTINCQRIEFNIDGMKRKERQAEHLLGADPGYVQLFTSGHIEAINFSLWNPNAKEIDGPQLIAQMFEKLPRYFRALNNLGVGYPFVFRFTIFFSEQLYIKLQTAHRNYASYPISAGLKDIKFPEIWYENWESLSDTRSAFRPWLDSLYNMAGVSHCPLYDSEGQWVGYK